MRSVCFAMLGVSFFSFCPDVMFAGEGKGVWLQAGPVYRGGMEVSTKRSNSSGMYEDGYVRRDPGTGNSSSLDPNTTWNWGYEHSSQYDASSGTLMFHQPGSLNDGSVWGGGVELIVGLPLFDTLTEEKKSGFLIDACVGFQAIPWCETVEGKDVVDVYDVSGISIPDSYHGTYDGPFDDPPVIPSPVIPSRPSGRFSTKLSLDTDIYELWLGPRLAWQPAEGFALYATPKLSLTCVDVDISRSSSFERGYSGGGTDNGETKLLWGEGVVLGADYAFGKGFFAGAWLGYEWVNDDVTANVGSGRVSVDVSGYTAGAAVGYRF